MEANSVSILLQLKCYEVTKHCPIVLHRHVFQPNLRYNSISAQSDQNPPLLATLEITRSWSIHTAFSILPVQINLPIQINLFALKIDKTLLLFAPILNVKYKLTFRTESG